MVEQKVEQIERLPIDPGSVKGIRTRVGLGGLGGIYALGRDELEGSVFIHLWNYESLQECEKAAKAWSECAGGIYVPGVGIDDHKSRLSRMAYLDHHRIGLWGSVKTQDERLVQRLKGKEFKRRKIKNV